MSSGLLLCGYLQARATSMPVPGPCQEKHRPSYSVVSRAPFFFFFFRCALSDPRASLSSLSLSQSIPLPKGKNLTLTPLPPKNLTAIKSGLKAVLEEALQQNGDVLATFKNNTKAELAEEVEEWRTEHDDGPPGKVLWKLLPKGR